MIEGWEIVSKLLSGDVVSNGQHVGFYVSQHLLLSSHPVYGVRENYFDMSNVTYRRYVGDVPVSEQNEDRISRGQWH